MQNSPAIIGAVTFLLIAIAPIWYAVQRHKRQEQMNNFDVRPFGESVRIVDISDPGELSGLSIDQRIAHELELASKQMIETAGYEYNMRRIKPCDYIVYVRISDWLIQRAKQFKSGGK